MTNFEQAFNYLMVNEGTEFVDNPLDSGGPTKFGITMISYLHFKNIAITTEMVKNLTLEDAQEFYQKVYWDELCLDEFQYLATQIAIFDSSVLYGMPTAVRLAQKAASICGAVLKFDGIIGDKTIEVVNLIPEKQFVTTFQQMIIARINTVVSANPKNQVFIQGWINRADRLLTLVP